MKPELAAEWDALVGASPDAWLHSLFAWQQLMARVPEWRFSDQSFAVFENGSMVAVMPLQLTPSGVLMSSVMGPAGPALAAGLTDEQRRKILRGLCDHLRNLAARLGAAKVQVAMSALSETSRTAPRGVNPLVVHGFLDCSTHTLIVDLSRPESEILSGMAYDARRSSNLARNAGYSVERSTWTEMLETYYRIHSETYTRTGVTPHPKAYFEGIAELAQRGHAVLWVGRNASGQPVAFHNCARFGKTSLYWTGCCESEHLKSGINYLLCQEAILGARNDGCELYEVGEYFPGVAEGKHHGLSVFKGKFGGDIHRYFRGEIHLRGARQRLLSEWQVATRSLIATVAGERAAKVVGAGVRLIGRTARASKAIAGSFRWRLINIAPLRIPFLKPWWSAEEDGVGLSETPVNAEQARQEFSTAFRSALKLDSGATVIPTGSGRAALSLALKVLKRKHPEKTKVILPTYGCRGTVDPVIENGLTPVFVDLTPDLLPDMEETRRRLASDSLACLVVHLSGKLLPVEPVLREARKRGVVVIEDHCQSLGAQARFGGSRGDISIYSFGIGKSAMATTGGAVVASILTDDFESEGRSLKEEDPTLARERFRYFRRILVERKAWQSSAEEKAILGRLDEHYRDWLTMNPVDARIAALQLAKLDRIIERSAANAAAIVGRIKEFGSLFGVQPAEQHVYTKLLVRLKDAEQMKQFRRHMRTRGIELEGMYTPLHLREFCAGYRRGVLRNSEQFYPCVMNVPVRPDLTDAEVERIASAIKSFGAAHE